MVSEYGSPNPPVGTHVYSSGTVVSGSVDSVTVGLTNYSASGWSLEGELLAGLGNSFELPVENDVVLTWNWQTNYWLDVEIIGGGTVGVPLNQFRPKDSLQGLTATPATGWLFMGWSGDETGTNLSVDITMNAPKSVLAVFSDDADGDGLTNNEEEVVGSNPWKADTDGDGFDDAFEFAKGLSPTNDDSDVATYIQNHDDFFGLYASNAVLDVAVGQMLMDVVGSEALLSLQLETSEDLVTWTNAGDAVEWTMPVDGEKKFLRVRAER